MVILLVWAPHFENNCLIVIPKCVHTSDFLNYKKVQILEIPSGPTETEPGISHWLWWSWIISPRCFQLWDNEKVRWGLFCAFWLEGNEKPDSAWERNKKLVLPLPPKPSSAALTLERVGFSEHLKEVRSPQSLILCQHLAHTCWVCDPSQGLHGLS